MKRKRKLIPGKDRPIVSNHAYKALRAQLNKLEWKLKCIKADYERTKGHSIA